MVAIVGVRISRRGAVVGTELMHAGGAAATGTAGVEWRGLDPSIDGAGE